MKTSHHVLTQKTQVLTVTHCHTQVRNKSAEYKTYLTTTI